MATLIEKIRAARYGLDQLKNLLRIGEDFKKLRIHTDSIEDLPMLSEAISVIENLITQDEIPYGDWLTGNVDLLESLPEGSRLMLEYKDGSWYLMEKLEKYWSSLEVDFNHTKTSKEIADNGYLIGYQILRPRPIPTTPEHEQA